MTACRVCLLIVAFSAGAAAQVPAPPADSPLLAAQQSIDAGHFPAAEAELKTYLADHPQSAEAHALLAFVLFKENNPRGSVSEYLESAKYRPLSALDMAAVGADYLLLEDSVNASIWLKKAYAADPKSAVTLYLWGRALYNQQHFQDAATRFEESLALEPDNRRTLGQLALADQHLGKTEDAAATYRRALALPASDSNHDEAQLRIEYGSLLIESGKASEAVPLLAEAVRLEPADMRAHRELGKAYLRTGDLGKAQTELEAARQIDAQNAPTRFLLSQVYSRTGRPDDAKTENAAYLALSKQGSAPDDPLREARSLASSANWPAAEQQLHRYLETHPASADAHFLLGYVLFKQKNATASLAEYTAGAKYRTPAAADFEAIASDYVLLHDYLDAAKWFARAVELEPANFQARYFLARALYNDNRFDEAVAAFEQCLKLDPKSVKAEDNLGLSYEGLGRMEEAEAAYRAAISWQAAATERDPGPYVNLGALLVSTGKPEEAVSLLQEAVKLDPRMLAAHRELGKAYGYLGQLEKAQQELERTVELAPDTPVPHYLLAQVYRKRGLLDKAKAESDRYKELVATHSTDDVKPR